MGIFKYAVVGIAAFVLMPMPPAEQNANAPQPAAAVQTEDIVSVAFGTFTDLASFCVRQPQTCEAMTSIAAVAQAKAKYSIRLAYEWANGREGDAHSPAATTTGNQPLPAAVQPVPAMPTTGTGDAEEASTTILKQSSADPLVTGSNSRVAANEEGTNSLRLDDLIPEWRGPAPARES